MIEPETVPPACRRPHMPYPAELQRMIDQLRYKPGWTFRLEDMDLGRGYGGLTLVINMTCPDSYHPERQIHVSHYFPVPPLPYDVQSWRRWLFDQILLAERHEAMEHFQIGTDRPYVPPHRPGSDAYMIREPAVDVGRRASAHDA